VHKQFSSQVEIFPYDYISNTYQVEYWKIDETAPNFLILFHVPKGVQLQVTQKKNPLIVKDSERPIEVMEYAKQELQNFEPDENSR
jgi:hypothetical protein